MHLYWSEDMDMQYLVNATEPHRTVARCITLQLRSQSITKHLQNVLSATQIGNAICTCSISKSSAGKRLLLRLIIIIIMKIIGKKLCANHIHCRQLDCAFIFT